MQIPSATTADVSCDTDSPESIGRELREALHTVRIRSLSLHDANGDVLWLSEDVLGPDEHGVVLEAMAAHSLESGLSSVERSLTDGRSAVLLPARTEDGDVAGLAMLIVDANLSAQTLKTKINDPRMLDALARLAAQQQQPAESPEAAAAAAETAPAGRVGLAPDESALDEETTGVYPVALRPKARTLNLVVQKILPLSSGDDTRHYEVLLRSPNKPMREALPRSLARELAAPESTFAVYRHVLTDLITWLGSHRGVWDPHPAAFIVNAFPNTFPDHRLLSCAAALLAQWNVPASCVGFEIPEQACVDAPGAVQAFVAACEAHGCFITLDNFSMHSAALPFLASPAVRLVKIDSRLIAATTKDKRSEAVVTAISRLAKVYGLRCVAKGIDSIATGRWLSANGIDLAQGFALQQLLPLDALLSRSDDGCVSVAAGQGA
jgi:EAL domain-containing protein (putative c-di-GMP-specific phosphodiesterase class I)